MDKSKFEQNFAVTHRLDSESAWTYFKVRDLKTDQIVAPSRFVRWREVDNNFFDEKLFRLAKQKKKEMIGVISHCNANSNRDGLIMNLKNFIKFDLYGTCGSLM